MVTPARRKEVLGEYGPAIRALPNHRWRAFVEFYMLENPGRGKSVEELRAVINVRGSMIEHGGDAVGPK